MALTDADPRVIFSAGGAVPLTLAGTVVRGDLIGNSSGWVQADADGNILAEYIAGEDGISGDVITAYKQAVVDNYTLGTARATLYLSDTAGAASETATQQIVGIVLSASTARLALPEQPTFADVGSYSTPVTSAQAGDTFSGLWALCTGAGHVYGQRLNIQVTSPTATTSQALRAELDLYPASAGSPSGATAIHAAAELGPNATGVSGIFAGLNASVITSAATRSLNGTYAALVLQTEFKAGNTMPAATTSFLRMADAGAVKSPLLFDTAGVASASDGAWEADSGAVGGTVLGYYKVQTAAGAGYVVVYSSHS